MSARKKPDPASARRRAYTLIEAIVVLVLMAIVVSMGVPRFSRSLEQARADAAAATLRAVWTGERLYWLEHRQYTDLNTLASQNLVDLSACSGVFYAYSAASGADEFVATAERINSGTRGGSLQITQDGTITNMLTNSTGDPIPVVNP